MNINFKYIIIPASSSSSFNYLFTYFVLSFFLPSNACAALP
ncbi:hypothetical protein PP707_02865 [Acetobacter pasteurianus]|nr:hypothetical protein [Acetobacter pasteurianus]